MAQHNTGVVSSGGCINAPSIGDHQPAIELVVQGTARKLPRPAIHIPGMGPRVINTIQSLIDTQFYLQLIHRAGKRQWLGVVLKGTAHLVGIEWMRNQQ